MICIVGYGGGPRVIELGKLLSNSALKKVLAETESAAGSVKVPAGQPVAVCLLALSPFLSSFAPRGRSAIERREKNYEHAYATD